jgi:hypothetical protein
MKQPKNLRDARLQHKFNRSNPRKTAAESNGGLKSYLNRGTAIGVFVGMSLAISVPSLATSTNTLMPAGTGTTTGSAAHSNVGTTTTTTSQPGTGSVNVLQTGGTSATDGSQASLDSKTAVNQTANTTQSSVEQDVQSCATSEDGLVKAATDAMRVRAQVFSNVVDVDNIFRPAKSGGCFAELGKIPDLSVQIPSYNASAIKNALMTALKDYATKKVCDAMYEATSELVGPINEVINDLESYSQAYDFAKEFAGTAGGKLGVDPNIFMPEKKEYTYTIDKGFQEVTGGTSSGTGTTTGSGTGTTTGGTSSGSVTGGTTTGSNGSQKDDPYSAGADYKTSAARNASAMFGSGN